MYFKIIPTIRVDLKCLFYITLEAILNCFLHKYLKPLLTSAHNFPRICIKGCTPAYVTFLPGSLLLMVKKPVKKHSPLHIKGGKEMIFELGL